MLSLCRIEPIVSMLCSTNSHKMYKYPWHILIGQPFLESCGNDDISFPEHVLSFRNNRSAVS